MKTSLKAIVLLLGFINALAATALAAEPAVRPGPDTGSRPCRIIETVAANYPLRLMQSGVRNGTVMLVLAVDETGRLSDTLVTAYSHKPFAEEALRVVREWRFEPGLSQGQPVTTIMNLTFNFEVEGLLVCDVKGGVTPFRMPGWEERLEFETRGAGDLDRRPVPVKVVNPTYPKSWADRGIVGAVTVEFYIDEHGRVRMPHVPAGGDDRLEGIALAAVQQWEFPPPTWKGRPVLTKARQVLEFVKK